MKSTGIVGVLLLIILAGAPAWGQEELVKTTPDEILTIYGENELAADLRFKDKRVQVSGVVYQISSKRDGTPYVVFNTATAGGLLYTYFSRDKIEALVKLKKGQNLTVTCTVQEGGTRSVDLDNCTLD